MAKFKKRPVGKTGLEVTELSLGSASLAGIFSEVPDDQALVEELYLRCLAREPKQTELQTCLDHVRVAGTRGDAFEDILWSLVNSTEFLNRK